MRFESLKQTVQAAIDKQQFTKSTNPTINNVNKILTGILLLNAMENLIGINGDISVNLKNTADNYAITYKGIAESMDGKYISYKNIKRSITSFNLSSFLQITRSQCDKIIQFYKNKQEVEKFNTVIFSPAMYNIGNLTSAQVNALGKAHKLIIVPIVQHYLSYNKKTLDDVMVECDEDAYPGKVIKLAISGIPCVKIYSDINKDIFNVKSYILKYDMTEDGFIQIIVK